MDRWVDKVAIVTGASSGIGQAIAQALIKNGLKVVGLARRLEKMEEFQNEMKNEKGKFFPIQCDLTKEEDILKAFEWTKKHLGGVHILVNNAGTSSVGKIIESSTESYKNIMDLNVIAVAICIREAVKIMKENNTAGHIININSVKGKSTAKSTVFCNMYCPSKFALKAMTEVIESELHDVESLIKITSVFPGLVKTDMVLKNVLEKFPYVDADDIADGVIYALSTPPHVQVNDLTITPVPGRPRHK